MKNDILSLNPVDFELAFGEPISKFVSSKVYEYDFRYMDFDLKEYEDILLKIIKTIFENELVKAGSDRHDQWEAGWAENFEQASSTNLELDSLLPRYFGKYKAVRWCGKFIKPVSHKFEYYSLAIILDWIFEKYLAKSQHVCEFGCGSGHNLLRVRSINKSADIVGLDWAESSQKIVKLISEKTTDPKLSGVNFNYFNPNSDFKLRQDSVVYTVASLEQIGSGWRPFVDYLLKSKPSLCVHIEPIGELLDQEVLIDWLSLKYFEKRNYLNGFLTGLRELESQGKVEIIEAKRSNIGSLFIEGYSLVVWRPL
jgi:hypothetical protein